MIVQNIKRKKNFLRIHLSLQKEGVDTQTLYKELGIQDRDFSSESNMVSMACYLDVLNRAATISNRPCLGVEIAKNISHEDLGALGYMIRNAPNLEHSLKILHSYLGLVSPGATTDLIREPRRFTWTYEIRGFSPEQSRQDVEMSMMQLVNHIRRVFTSDSWLPCEVFFRHSAPEDTSPITNALGDHITFNHFFNGISVPIEFLEIPVNDADVQLLRVLEQQVQRSIDLLNTESGLLEHISLMISSWLGKTDISADRAAKELGMSRRTLHRRLRELGTSFHEQKELVISKAAREILGSTGVNVTQVAQQLGYSDASAFNRAFKRSTGLTPLNYRKTHTKNS